MLYLLGIFNLKGFLSLHKEEPLTEEVPQTLKWNEGIVHQGF